MTQICAGDFYLSLKKKGWAGLTGRLTKSATDLAAGEVSVKVSVQLPAALFDRPQLQASIIIPEGALSAPVIDATVLDNVREIIQQQLGIDLKIQLVEPVEE